jgi:hypothetical protein
MNWPKAEIMANNIKTKIFHVRAKRLFILPIDEGDCPLSQYYLLPHDLFD